MLNFDFWDKEWPVIVAAPHIAIFGAITLIVATAAIVWWFRGFIHRERMELSKDRVEKAREDAREIGQKLIEAESKNVELMRLIDTSAPSAVLSAKATSTGVIFSQLRTASDTLQTTLGPMPGYHRTLTPPRRGPTEGSEN